MTGEHQEELPVTEDREERQRIHEAAVDVVRHATQLLKVTERLQRGHSRAANFAAVQNEIENLADETDRIITCFEREVGKSFAENEGPRPTPGDITSEHADRLEERYDRRVLTLALMLLEDNRRRLYESPETMGARHVERHGLTENQRMVLDDLQEAWEVYQVTNGGDDDAE